MTNRKLLSLVVAAGVMLAVTVILYSGEESAPVDFAPGSLLIQGLDPEAVHTIQITSGDTNIELQRSGGIFLVVSKNNYPANIQRVNDLLIAALEIRCATKITDSAANHDSLGVAENSTDAAIVRLLDRDGQLLTGVVRGQSVEGGTGQYVRRLNSDVVFASEGWVSINTNAQQFLDTVLTRVDTAKIARVDVAAGSDTYSITQDENNQIALMDIPDGMQPKGRQYESVFRAGANLSFTDVKPAGEINAPFDDTYTMELRSGLKYTIKSARVDGKAWVRLSADAPRVDGRISIGVDESKEELEKKEELVTAAETARKFNERHADWVYEISTWSADNLIKPLGDLIEASTTASDSPPSAPAPGTDDPSISPADIIMLDEPGQIIDLTDEPAPADE